MQAEGWGVWCNLSLVKERGFYPAHERVAFVTERPLQQVECDPQISSLRYGAMNVIGDGSCPLKAL